MRAVAVVVIVLVALNVSADTGQSGIAFEPIYAYQQKNITFNSLSQEINQFQSLNQWHSVRGELLSQRLEVGLRRRAFERGQKLFEKKQISEVEFARRTYDYERAQFRFKELEARAEMTRVFAEISRYGLQQNGDEQLDFRREIASKMRESLQFQMKALEHSLQNAHLTERLLKKDLDRARELYERGVITTPEMDKREIEYSDVVIRVETLSHQIEVIGMAIDGFNKSLDRLFGEGPQKGHG